MTAGDSIAALETEAQMLRSRLRYETGNERAELATRLEELDSAIKRKKAATPVRFDRRNERTARYA